METKALNVEGIELVMPVFLVQWWPHQLPLDRFPSFCGAGGGLGDALVPENCYGLPLSPACFVHDISWRVVEATWAGFHQGNSMFLHNNLAIINARSRFPLKQLRAYRAVTYFNAVDTIGAKYFWDDKWQFGTYEDPLEDPIVLEKLARVGVEPLRRAA
ncbi:hypothetical protein [Desulfofustis glycolicus]|uniref:Uncharacterized protein n=1 Tax=Desulfofustis glycolicus DSM 9705 TaxID=1121409 RepID=A0A1M5S361_9BACT|nr:hypothetical protein [Desulfofustis glycolicus]SHH33037.1 hypothetical protein SAMN02745124_00143 [Desulfofustis glycolicus DSM 9705]